MKLKQSTSNKRNQVNKMDITEIKLKINKIEHELKESEDHYTEIIHRKIILL